MTDFGEEFQRHLERVRQETLAPRSGPKPTFDVARTMERFQRIIDDLQRAGAAVAARKSWLVGPSAFETVLTIGSSDYSVGFRNDTIKVFWRSRDQIPMIYDVLSPSRVHALARAIIERAVASALQQELHPRNAASRVVKFPQS